MAGATIATLEQRDVFKDAPAYGAQLALEYRPELHFLGSFTWSLGMDRFGLADDKVNVYQYDVGVEYNLIHPIGANWELKPFIGIGGGGRAYDYAAAGLETQTCAAGYGALGTELQYGVVALRLEARNYVYCFRNPVTDVSKTRDDVGFTAGFAYHIGHRVMRGTKRIVMLLLALVLLPTGLGAQVRAASSGSDLLLRVNGPVQLRSGDAASTVVVIGHDADIMGTVIQDL